MAHVKPHVIAARTLRMNKNPKAPIVRLPPASSTMGASIGTAVAAAQILDEKRTDVRVGIVADIVLPIVERTAQHTALIADSRCWKSFGGLAVLHHMRGRGRFLVIA